MEKTARGLVEYAIAQLGKPYWYGTFGDAASRELYEQKKRQYPEKYTWAYDPSVAGQKVHDCVGLYKGYMWCDGPKDDTAEYVGAEDKSANMLRSACKTTGNMTTMPDVPGVIVFYNGHMGVYIGGGEVVEARGRKYGVVKTKLADRPWTSWGYCPYITYEEPKKEEDDLVTLITLELPVLQKGDKSETVRAMQNLLLAAGYEMKSTDGKTTYGADTSYGGATKRAVEAYQTKNGLPVTGECDAATWRKLLGL